MAPSDKGAEIFCSEYAASPQPETPRGALRKCGRESAHPWLRVPHTRERDPAPLRKNHTASNMQAARTRSSQRPARSGGGDRRLAQNSRGLAQAEASTDMQTAAAALAAAIIAAASAPDECIRGVCAMDGSEALVAVLSSDAARSASQPPLGSKRRCGSIAAAAASAGEENVVPTSPARYQPNRTRLAAVRSLSRPPPPAHRAVGADARRLGVGDEVAVGHTHSDGDSAVNRRRPDGQAVLPLSRPASRPAPCPA